MSKDWLRSLFCLIVDDKTGTRSVWFPFEKHNPLTREVIASASTLEE